MGDTLRSKYIASLTFRGFDMLPSEVESLVGVTANELGIRGTPRSPGTRPLKRSFASWKLEFSDSARLDEMIPALLKAAGGADHLVQVRLKVQPEFLDIDLAMWIKDSPDQEGGFLGHQTMVDLAKLGGGISFSFYSRHAG